MRRRRGSRPGSTNLTSWHAASPPSAPGDVATAARAHDPQAGHGLSSAAPGSQPPHGRPSRHPPVTGARMRWPGRRSPVYKSVMPAAPHATRRSFARAAAAFCAITHFTQSGCVGKRIGATLGVAIPVRPEPEVPAAQERDERPARSSSLYTDFGAVADSAIWGNGSCRSSDTFSNSSNLQQKRTAEDTIADVGTSGLRPGKVVTEVTAAGSGWLTWPSSGGRCATTRCTAVLGCRGRCARPRSCSRAWTSGTNG